MADRPGDPGADDEHLGGGHRPGRRRHEREHLGQRLGRQDHGLVAGDRRPATTARPSTGPGWCAAPARARRGSPRGRRSPPPPRARPWARPSPPPPARSADAPGRGWPGRRPSPAPWPPRRRRARPRGSRSSRPCRRRPSSGKPDGLARSRLDHHPRAQLQQGGHHGGGQRYSPLSREGLGRRTDRQRRVAHAGTLYGDAENDAGRRRAEARWWRTVGNGRSRDG